MIKCETDTGCIGKYLRAYLIIGSTRIDLGDGDSMNEGEAGKVADDLQAAANEIRMFANRNSEPVQTQEDILLKAIQKIADTAPLTGESAYNMRELAMETLALIKE